MKYSIFSIPALLVALVLGSAAHADEVGPWAFVHGHGGREILTLGSRQAGLIIGYEGTTWGCAGKGASYQIIRNYLMYAGPNSDVNWRILATCQSPEGIVQKICIKADFGGEVCSGYLQKMTMPLN